MKLPGKQIIIFFSLCMAGLLGVHFTHTQNNNTVPFNQPPSFPAPLYTVKGNQLSAQKIELGRYLFYDPLLSANNTISCAGCHQSFAAFAHIDHALSHGINNTIGLRNVPALQNLAWKDAWMWDGSITNLDQQPITPITHPGEMGETMLNVVSKLNNNIQYRSMFATAFSDSTVTAPRILESIKEFMLVLVSADSRYDRYMAGKETFTPAETNGLALFRKNCASCHKEPLFTDNSYSNNGLALDSSLNDKGRFVVTGKAADMYHFKVPSLRNIQFTMPYMHDGRFTRLKQVMDHYSNITSSRINTDERLHRMSRMEENEKKDLIAFLLTLTDTAFLSNSRFADPNEVR